MSKILMVIHSLFFFLLSSSTLWAQQTNRVSPEAYINTYKAAAIEEMRIFHIPASITLAQGMLESANGNSDLAIHARNHFGIKCHLDWEGPGFYKDDDAKNECFRVYNNVWESYRDHSLFLKHRSRYASLFELDITDYKGWAHGLKKAGYATEPTYAHRLIKLIEKHLLFEFDLMMDSNIVVSGEDNKAEDDEPLAGKNIKVSKGEDFDAITISSQKRKVYENNNVEYILAMRDDNPDRIAMDMGMAPWQIRKYNELKKGEAIIDGQFIYLQPKRRKASVDYYIVQDSISMREISQMFAVKLKRLYKMNEKSPGDQPRPGEKIRLR